MRVFGLHCARTETCKSASNKAARSSCLVRPLSVYLLATPDGARAAPPRSTHRAKERAGDVRISVEPFRPRSFSRVLINAAGGRPRHLRSRDDERDVTPKAGFLGFGCVNELKG